jgi:hypothetical protein
MKSLRQKMNFTLDFGHNSMRSSNSNPLDDRPLHEVHPELFHYTDAVGLDGILRSQSLWGTHWQYLNDAGELRHFSEKLPSLLKSARIALAGELARNRNGFKEWAESQGGIEGLVDAEIQELVRVFQDSIVPSDPKQQIFEFYITSFCTPEGSFEEVRTHGLLSMWRGYANGGYALVFDTTKLDRLLRIEAEEWPSRMVLGDVGYSCDPPHELNSRITSFAELREKLSESSLDLPEAFEVLLEPLMDCFIHFKHWAFAEEREVRLTTILNGGHMRAVHEDDGTARRERERDRHVKDGKTHIHLFEGLGHRLPIKRVIVGPGADQPTRAAELSALLEELKLDIPMVLSNIPLR